MVEEVDVIEAVLGGGPQSDRVPPQRSADLEGTAPESVLAFVLDLTGLEARVVFYRREVLGEKPRAGSVAVGRDVQVDRYRPSSRPFPETLPPVEYDASLETRKVQDKGELRFRGRIFKVSRALRRHTIALRPTTRDGLYDVFFCHQPIAEIDLRDPSN